MEHGIIRVAQHRGYDSTKTIPEVMLRNDDYGRIERLLADGEDVKAEFNIVNRDYPEGKTSYNVVGEIPGTDKADEIVMLGGHLDSWQSATGAKPDIESKGPYGRCSNFNSAFLRSTPQR